MSNFVKLPSGEGVSVTNITNFKMYEMRLIDADTEEYGAALHIWFGPHEVVYTNADARALYAYLSAQAVTIGEDGKEVGADAEMEMVR